MLTLTPAAIAEIHSPIGTNENSINNAMINYNNNN